MMGRTAPKGAFLNVTSYSTFDVKFATNHTATFLVCQQRENHLFSTIYLIAHREKCLCYLPSEPLIWTLCFWLWESSPPIKDGIFWCLLFFVVGIDNLFVMEWNGMDSMLLVSCLVQFFIECCDVPAIRTATFFQKRSIDTFRKIYIDQTTEYSA